MSLEQTTEKPHQFNPSKLADTEFAFHIAIIKGNLPEAQKRYQELIIELYGIKKSPASNIATNLLAALTTDNLHQREQSLGLYLVNLKNAARLKFDMDKARRFARASLAGDESAVGTDITTILFNLDAGPGMQAALESRTKALGILQDIGLAYQGEERLVDVYAPIQYASFEHYSKDVLEDNNPPLLLIKSGQIIVERTIRPSQTTINEVKALLTAYYNSLQVTLNRQPSTT